jgi:hypothetical protein
VVFVSEEQTESQSVEEFVEEGNSFEADVVTGVKHADNDEKKKRRGVHILNVLHDDAPRQMFVRREVSVASHGGRWNCYSSSPPDHANCATNPPR